MEWMRFVPSFLMTPRVCRALIRRSISNAKWVPESVMEEPLFNRWFGLHVDYHGVRDNKEWMETGNPFAHGDSGVLKSLLGMDCYEDYKDLLAPEWMDREVASGIVVVDKNAYKHLDPRLLSDKAIGGRLFYYPYDATEFINYLGKVDWISVISRDYDVMRKIPEPFFREVDIDALVSRFPSCINHIPEIHIDYRVIKVAMRVFSLDVISERFFSHPRFMEEVLLLNPCIKERGEAAHYVLSEILYNKNRLACFRAKKFLNAYGDLLMSYSRERLMSCITQMIEIERGDHQKMYTLTQVALSALMDELNDTDLLVISYEATGSYRAGDVMLYFYFKGTSLEDVAPFIESERVWRYMFDCYPKEAILNYPEARRFLLSHEMGL